MKKEIIYDKNNPFKVLKSCGFFVFRKNEGKIQFLLMQHRQNNFIFFFFLKNNKKNKK